MKPNVLLVEDNKINQLVARKVLEKAGFAVDVATSAEEAFDRLHESHYGLVLMDVQMPGIDGAEATRMIRSGQAAVIDPAVPVIAMTAYTSEDDQQRFEACGMNGFLAKPLDVDELIERVRAFAESETSREPLALNDEELSARVGGDRALAQDIVTGFASDLPKRMRELADAVDADDWETARGIGHLIAGAASNVAAAELVRFGRAVEEAAQERNVSRARQLLASAEGVVGRFEHAATEVGYRG